MHVSYTDIFIDEEDEMQSIETYLDSLEYIYNLTSARWMWLDSEWSEYVIEKVRLKKQLRKIKAKVEYNKT